MNASTYLQVQITFPDRASAEKAAKSLIELRLAACAQICGEIRSLYTWKGVCESSLETLLLAKTKAALFDRLIEAVRERHPYDCPQIVALPIVAANEDYLDWLDEQVGGS